MPLLKYKGKVIKLPYTKAGKAKAKRLVAKGARRINYKY